MKMFCHLNFVLNLILLAETIKFRMLRYMMVEFYYEFIMIYDSCSI